MSIESFYGDWRRYNELVVAGLGRMSDNELALRAASGDIESSTHWPIWAIAGHTAAARVHWLCNAFGEPGQDTTPFRDPDGPGWEDDLDHPRTVDELVEAWTTTWAVVEHCLATWTPDMLDGAVAREGARGIVHLTRRSILLRLISHDAYHVGEIALIQGIHGRPSIDLWPPGYHTVEAAAGLL